MGNQHNDKRQRGPSAVTTALGKLAISDQLTTFGYGLALVWFSPQNIDRFVSLFRATKRSGRIVVADAYLANILDAIGLRSLPSPRARQMRIFLPGMQKRRIVRDRRFDLIEPYRANRIFLPELMTHPERWVMLFRPSMIDDLGEPGKLAETRLIYSLWPGYLENDSFDIQAWCANHLL